LIASREIGNSKSNDKEHLNITVFEAETTQQVDGYPIITNI